MYSWPLHSSPFPSLPLPPHSPSYSFLFRSLPLSLLLLLSPHFISSHFRTRIIHVNPLRISDNSSHRHAIDFSISFVLNLISYISSSLYLSQTNSLLPLFFLLPFLPFSLPKITFFFPSLTVHFIPLFISPIYSFSSHISSILSLLFLTVAKSLFWFITVIIHSWQYLPPPFPYLLFPRIYIQIIPLLTQNILNLNILSLSLWLFHLEFYIIVYFIYFVISLSPLFFLLCYVILPFHLCLKIIACIHIVNMYCILCDSVNCRLLVSLLIMAIFNYLVVRCHIEFCYRKNVCMLYSNLYYSILYTILTNFPKLMIFIDTWFCNSQNRICFIYIL